MKKFKKVFNLIKKLIFLFFLKKYTYTPIWEIADDILINKRIRYFFRKILKNLFKINEYQKNKFIERNLYLSDLEKSIVNEIKSKGYSSSKFEKLFSNYKYSQLKSSFFESSNFSEKINSLKHAENLSFNGEIFADESLASILLEDCFYKIFFSVYGVIPRLAYCQKSISKPTNKTKTGSQCWHKDNEDESILKIFIYFNDVKISNGPFELIPNSSISPDSLRGDQLKTNKKLNQLIKNKITFCVDESTIIFANTRNYHRGGFCKEGYRYSLQIGLVSSIGKINIYDSELISRKYIDKYNIGNIANLSLLNKLVK